jgi:hypothetical protein
MGDSAFPEAEQTRATNRAIWLVLTVVFTFISGASAAKGDWMLVWMMLGLWVFTGFLLAVCHPGQKQGHGLWQRR